MSVTEKTLAINCRIGIQTLTVMTISNTYRALTLLYTLHRKCNRPVKINQEISCNNLK